MREVEFESNGHKLVGTYVCPAGGASKVLLRLSGGANIGYSPNEWQDMLAKEGIASFAFDFAGVERSEGELSNTNLNTRYDDSLAAYQVLHEIVGGEADIYVLGVSMGGPLAIWFASEVPVSGLLLAVAAAYPVDSHDKNFGEAFSQAIRGDGLWETSIEFEKLRQVPSPILFAAAKHDKIIPISITKRYEAIVLEKGGRVLEYDAEHPFLRSSSDYPKERQAFWAAVADFIQNT